MSEASPPDRRVAAEPPEPGESMRREGLIVLGTAAGGVAGAGAVAFGALCCVGPSTVALLGAGGALAAATLSPYRPLLLAMSLAAVAFGFWRVHGRRVVARTATGRSCPVPVGRFARTALWVAAAVWIVAAILPAS